MESFDFLNVKRAIGDGFKANEVILDRFGSICQCGVLHLSADNSSQACSHMRNFCLHQNSQVVNLKDFCTALCENCREIASEGTSTLFYQTGNFVMEGPQSVEAMFKSLYEVKAFMEEEKTLKALFELDTSALAASSFPAWNQFRDQVFPARMLYRWRTELRSRYQQQYLQAVKANLGKFASTLKFEEPNWLENVNAEGLDQEDGYAVFADPFAKGGEKEIFTLISGVQLIPSGLASWWRNQRVNPISREKGPLGTVPRWPSWEETEIFLNLFDPYARNTYSDPFAALSAAINI